MKAIKSVWTAFKTKPMKFGIGMFLVAISIFMFFGGVNFKIKHGDTNVEVTTQAKQ